MRPLLLAAALALAGCATAPVPSSATPVPAAAPWPGTSTLEVRVVDAAVQGAPRGGVPLTIQSTRLRRPVHAVTDDSGQVHLVGLPGGIYDVRTDVGERVVAQVPPHGGGRVELRSSTVHIIGCSGVPARPLDRSLLDDDAATEFLHEPRVIHRLP